jgi:pyruvate/2-oxoglutarate dehydrogenase complex dihydrolipoamide dehydrogenase (E3) component
MPGTENYDMLVIGSGEAGKYLGWTMASEGHRTAVVERQLIGGSCPNIACLPSKNIIHSAKVRSLAGRAAEFGVDAGPVTTSMKGVQDRKRAMVDGLRRLHLDRYRASGAELIMGHARFTAFGADASEHMAAVQVAMMARMPYTALRDGIFAHPTVAEGLTALLGSPPVSPLQ